MSDLPHVTLFNAVSVDGQTGGFPADLGLFYGLAAKIAEDATLVGSNTILAAETQFPADDSSYDTEPSGPEPDDSPAEQPQPDHRPLLIMVDSRGRLTNWNQWRRLPYWRGLVVFCSHSTPGAYLDNLSRQKIDAIVAGEEKVDLREALGECAARYGIRRIRVDSGGTLNGVLLSSGLVDEVHLLIHPSLVGGLADKSIFRPPNAALPESAIPLRLVELERLQGDHVWLRYQVVR